MICVHLNHFNVFLTSGRNILREFKNHLKKEISQNLRNRVGNLNNMNIFLLAFSDSFISVLVDLIKQISV